MPGRVAVQHFLRRARVVFVYPSCNNVDGSEDGRVPAGLRTNCLFSLTPRFHPRNKGRFLGTPVKRGANKPLRLRRGRRADLDMDRQKHRPL